MLYIYGPLNSRRLGLSLGVTLTAEKTCNFNCLYCQLGKTINATVQRKEYIPVQGILEELQVWLQNNPGVAKQPDYITLSGSGEPTLNDKIGQLIGEIKKLAPTPVAVITNASLLGTTEVRQQLAQADLIIPSLDAATPQVFSRINRPLGAIKITEIINGLVSLRNEFPGKIWLEIMLVKGLNDDLRQIKKLKEIITKINPDKIHLNSPVRATAEPGVIPVPRAKLQKIKTILGEKCEIL
jgi:wyosine [tRNA(Phe)-imidazoG37] synthetase (radical SAM superfamily)